MSWPTLVVYIASFAAGFFLILAFGIADLIARRRLRDRLRAELKKHIREIERKQDQ